MAQWQHNGNGNVRRDGNTTTMTETAMEGATKTATATAAMVGPMMTGMEDTTATRW